MILILMGVSGSGKTTIGQHLDRQLGWRFYEGDDFHPAANLQKVRQGIPLSDEDRQPWLEDLRHLVAELLQENVHAVVSCSALKHAYRKMLMVDANSVRFVYLKGDYGTRATKSATPYNSTSKWQIPRIG